MTEPVPEDACAALRAELASLRSVEHALATDLESTRAAVLPDERTRLEIEVALVRQRVAGLEVMLAKHRVSQEADPSSQQGVRGASPSAWLTAAGRRLRSLGSLSSAEVPSAWGPGATSVSLDAPRRARRTPTTTVDRRQLTYGRVFPQRGGSRLSGWKTSVRLGGTSLPLLQVPRVVFLPWLRLQVTDDLVAPEEVLHDRYTFDWVVSTFAGDTVTDVVAEVDEDVCILSNPYSFAFGHWVSEELIKVFVLETAGFRGRYVVTPAQPGGPIPGFVIESLEVMGIGPNRMITDLEGVTRFRSAVFTPPINRIRARSVADVYLAYRAAVVERVRPAEPGGPRRIWQVRDAAVGSGRTQLVNEDEIMPIVAEHGFELVDMGALSFRDQVALASETEVMAGPHGSGFIHTLFQPPGSTLIECFSPNFINTCFLEVCGILGHRYHMLIQHCAYEDYPWGLELKVDPVHLAVVLENLGSARP